MSGINVPNDIILFHYPFSPYARRIVWYMAFRGIPYAQCEQPFTLPRPDLNELGIKYRRIPLLSIGRDVYCDTRLIIERLEQCFASSSYPSLSSPQSAGIGALLDKFTVDAGIFNRAAQLLPTSMPLLNDKKFLTDREDFMGRSWAKADIEKGQPEAMAHMRRAFDLLETLLQDGRQWVAGTDDVSLADIQGIWPFDWLLSLNALPKLYFSDTLYPKTFAWIYRFRGALKSATKSVPKPVQVSGADAVKHISSAKFSAEVSIDSADPTGLKEGAIVEVWPIDSGFNHRDKGKLVSLTKDEVALEVSTSADGSGVRIHSPRWGFRIAAASGAKL